MTRSEAFREALAHREVRPVPYCIKFTDEAMLNLTHALGRPVDPVEETGNYVVAAHTNHGWEEVKKGYFRDFFGVIWNRTTDRTLGVVDKHPLPKPSLAGFSFPAPGDLQVYHRAQQNRLRYPDHFQMVSIGFALFERAWALTGMEDLLVYMVTEPVFVHELLDRIADFNTGVIRLAAQAGVDAVHFGDDWASQNGPIMSPDMWDTFIKPRFCRMCDTAHECGLLVSHHCCGNVQLLLPAMVECKVDVFDPFQPEVMDIWRIREEYRGRLAFWGGLSVQKTLPFGTPADVAEQSARLLKNMAAGGGYVFAPSHALTADVPVANMLKLIEVARQQPF